MKRFKHTYAKLGMILLLWFCGFNVSAIVFQAPVTMDDNIMSKIIGPYGALMLSLVSLYLLWKYIRRKDLEIQELRSKADEEKERYIKKLEKELTELRK